MLYTPSEVKTLYASSHYERHLAISAHGMKKPSETDWARVDALEDDTTDISDITVPDPAEEYHWTLIWSSLKNSVGRVIVSVEGQIVDGLSLLSLRDP